MDPEVPRSGRGRRDERSWASTTTGRVDVTHLLHRGQRRAVRTYLPPGFEQSTDPLPVLYMFDGQNLFDRSTTTFGMEWGIDETLEELCAAGRTDGIVVVGMDSPDDPYQRYAEYTAWDWVLDGRPIRADGRATAQFLVEQVLPHVQRVYGVSRDREQVGLAGSSMGGYMTLYAGACHADAFGRLLALSPVVLDEPMAGHHLRDLLAATAFPPGTWAYLDMGSAEELAYVDHPGRLVANLAQTTTAMRSSARPPQHVVSRVLPGAAHDERAWGARFGEVLLWAFADGPTPA